MSKYIIKWREITKGVAKDGTLQATYRTPTEANNRIRELIDCAPYATYRHHGAGCGYIIRKTGGFPGAKVEQVVEYWRESAPIEEASKGIDWCFRCGGVVFDPANSDVPENSRCCCNILDFNGPKPPPEGWANKEAYK